MLLLFTSCADMPEEEDLSPDVSIDPDEPILTRRNIEVTVWTDPGSGVDFINRAAAAFNRRYPNITINAVGVEPGDMVRRVRAEAGRGGADLFIVPHMEIRQLAEELLVLPARDQGKTRNAVFPACAQAATVNGIMYGYPVSSDTAALFYNKRLIAEEDLPATWEELTAFARGFDGGEEAYGFVMPVAGSVHVTASFLAARSNRPFGPGGENTKTPNLETSSAMEGMTVFKGLQSAVGLSSEELTAESAESLFASGRAALCATGSWSIPRFIRGGVDFGVTPLPAMPGDESSLASLAFSRVMLVSAHSEHPDEASWFAWQLLSEEMQALRLELTGELPSVALNVRSPAYAAGFISQMPSAYAAPSIPEAGLFWGVFAEAAARIWDGADVSAELSAAAEALRPPPEPEEPPADE
jgi:arabinogalactan oligomer/maltooligosaccharide transport system substrate-binding protein